MSVAALAESSSLVLHPVSGHDLTGIETGPCIACGHPEEAHQLLLTATVTYVICHEPTEDGECYRVRHSQGIAFGACRRDPP